MLKLENKNFKGTIMTTLKWVKENIFLMNEQIGHLNGEVEMTQKNQMKIL